MPKPTPGKSGKSGTAKNRSDSQYFTRSSNRDDQPDGVNGGPDVADPSPNSASGADQVPDHDRAAHPPDDRHNPVTGARASPEPNINHGPRSGEGARSAPAGRGNDHIMSLFDDDDEFVDSRDGPPQAMQRHEPRVLLNRIPYSSPHARHDESPQPGTSRDGIIPGLYGDVYLPPGRRPADARPHHVPERPPWNHESAPRRHRYPNHQSPASDSTQGSDPARSNTPDLAAALNGLSTNLENGLQQVMQQIAAVVPKRNAEPAYRTSSALQLRQERPVAHRHRQHHTAGAGGDGSSNDSSDDSDDSRRGRRQPNRRRPRSSSSSSSDDNRRREPSQDRESEGRASSTGSRRRRGVVRRQGYHHHTRLPPFTGQEPWKVYYNRFRDVAKLEDWSNDEMLRELLPRLQGKAGEFVYGQLNRGARSSFHALVHELEEPLPPSRDLQDLRSPVQQPKPAAWRERRGIRRRAEEIV